MPTPRVRPTQCPPASAPHTADPRRRSRSGQRAQRCAGSASVETAYVFPLSVDPGSASWAAPNQPNGGYRPFVSGTSAPGLRSHNQHDRPRSAFWFAGLHLAPGIYHVGVTCLVPVGSHNHQRGARLTAANGDTNDTLIAITANTKDPNGFTWSVCTAPPAQLAEAPRALALPLVGVLVAGGFVAVRRRRTRARHSPRRVRSSAAVLSTRALGRRGRWRSRNSRSARAANPRSRRHCCPPPSACSLCRGCLRVVAPRESQPPLGPAATPISPPMMGLCNAAACRNRTAMPFHRSPPTARSRRSSRGTTRRRCRGWHSRTGSRAPMFRTGRCR